MHVDGKFGDAGKVCRSDFSVVMFWLVSFCACKGAVRLVVL